MTIRDPLALGKYAVGFEDMINKLTFSETFTNTSYPPYNIRKTGDNSYSIDLALAGFKKNEIDISLEKNTLTITGSNIRVESNKVEYLHRGIADRAFTRQFTLNDNVEVDGASFVDGLLTISLVRIVPEAAKPKKIEINAPVTYTPKPEYLTESGDK